MVAEKNTWDSAVTLHDPVASPTTPVADRSGSCTVTDPIDWTLVSTTTVGWIQIGAIVGGHLVAVVVAHDRSVELWKPATALRSQYTMLAVMAAYTVAGLVLLTG